MQLLRQTGNIDKNKEVIQGEDSNQAFWKC